MAKKKKSFIALWLAFALGCATVAALLLVPVGKKVPQTQWRVPVQIELPSAPDLPDLPDMPEVQDMVPDLLEEEPAVQTPPADKTEKTTPQKGSGKIALIIDDMGPANKNTDRAVRLPPEVTLSFLPYVKDVAVQADRARAAGHDLMLHMPMEAVGGEQAGPCALMTGQPPDVWQHCLEKDLSAFNGFVGINNHMGSKFTLDEGGMLFVAEALKDKDLFFVDSRTHAKSVAQKIAHAAGIKTAGRDVFLDDTVAREAIQVEMRKAEQTARRKGQAIVIGHPHALTLDAIEKWIPDAQERGFRFVPVRELVE